MCIYIYIDTHTYPHSCIWVYIHIYIRIHMCILCLYGGFVWGSIGFRVPAFGEALVECRIGYMEVYKGFRVVSMPMGKLRKPLNPKT